MNALSTFAHALAAVDEAADARCDAIKLGISSQPPLPLAWGPKLFQRAQQRGIVLLARPADEIAVTRLSWIGAPAYDLAFDHCDHELIATAVRTGKPIVLQTGGASHRELADLVGLAQRGGGGLALMVPVTGDADLDQLDALRSLDVPVGIVDARADTTLVRAGIARGAALVDTPTFGHASRWVTN
ncbi:MAG: N-acetylneuraminate synthase family protein [Proteobacteria bacterium]|nr:N-acetylneuraminate synthase family protein [Pseudomonadota bacterium]